MNKNWIILLLISIGLYGANLGGTSVYVLDEAKNAACSMEMAQRGDWVVPTFNDELRIDKPPLHYFFMRVAFFMGGINPFTARFFSMLMGVAMVLVVYGFSKSIIGEQSAFWSALILTVSIQLSIQFHLAVPDPYLIFFLTLGWLSFYKGLESNTKFYFYIFYASIALATLSKGPVAIVFTGLIVLIFLIGNKRLNWMELARLQLIPGALLYLLIVLPWYVLVGMETNGEWLHGFFVEHNVSRFTKTMEGHGGFPLASFALILLALMPFSFFAPQAIIFVWKRKGEQPFPFYCLLVVGVVVVFFAFSKTLLPSYIEPALPFLAIVLGYYIGTRRPSKMSKGNIISGIAYLIISLLIPVAAMIALQQQQQLFDLAYLSVFCLLLSVGGIMGFILIMERRLYQAWTTYAISLGVFMLFFFYWVYPQIDQHNPVYLSQLEMDEGRPVHAYKHFNPAFVFSFQRTIPVLTSKEAINQLPQGQYMVTQKKYIHELPASSYRIVFEGEDLFEGGTTIVLEMQ